ncbi:MAG: NAD kinase [Bacteroidota bacterium]
MEIAIHGRLFNETAKPFIQSMFDELKSRDVEVQISKTYAEVLANAEVETHSYIEFESANDYKGADFLLSLGGDGTLLDSLTYIGAKETPILGINTGRLGFLATVSPENLLIELAMLFQGKFEIEKRSLVSIESNIDIFNGVNFGLNELGIMKTDTSSMIVIKTYLNDEFLNSYWADGLIVSTPTGSTGYNLSVGGPVVTPTAGIFVISPMSPHNLNVRPLVVSDNSKLRFEVESRSKSFLVSLDSRSKVVDDTTIISLKKESFQAYLVKIRGSDFLDTLRSKLNWGLDYRN